ncbi:hypothetical protein ACD591_17650 [Rufibacter glacialis]|uniref:Porin family protein n=1 Tax=Rufibacter glacialis TaxID=1259555 RepID=A0A5M8QGX0_9BACT|nr:hypothetical protein [Rufibacter glacialis]KAA6434401.1 hypothetical protein FOE74_09375 [Rufibacter glacialis]GGK69233.1 hypothetical protein GCM10011405_16680 [Rufibacter glacialis]
MRKLLYLSLLLLPFQQVNAQENRGTLVPTKIFQRTLMVGGSLSGSYKRINITSVGEPVSGHRQQADLDAKVGYFVLGNVAVGAKATIFHSKEELSGQMPVQSTNLLAGPFARYYLRNGIFGEGSAVVGINNRPGAAKTDIAEYKGGVGYAIFINPKVAVEPALLFSYYQEKRPAENNRKLTEWGPSVNVGMQVYLFRERKFKLAPR